MGARSTCSPAGAFSAYWMANWGYVLQRLTPGSSEKQVILQRLELGHGDGDGRGRDVCSCELPAAVGLMGLFWRMIDIIARAADSPRNAAACQPGTIAARLPFSYIRPFHSHSLFVLLFRAMGLRPPLPNGFASRRLISLTCSAGRPSPRTVQTRSVASSLRTRVASCRAFLPSAGTRLFARGKKTSTLEVKDLPQGLISGVPLEDPDEDAGPAYPTVLQQVRNNMRKFDHCVLLTRIGNFYEVCFKTSWGVTVHCTDWKGRCILSMPRNMALF